MTSPRTRESGAADRRARRDATSGSRLLVAAAVGIAGSWAIAVTRWEPAGFGAGAALGAVPFVLGLPALVGAALSTRGPWRRPTDLAHAGPSRLRAGAGRGFGWFVGGQVLILTAVTVPMTDVHWLTDEEAPTGLARYTLMALSVALPATAALLLAVLVAGVLHGRPRIDLTPLGIEVREPFGRRTIPWEALRPGTPLRQPSGHLLALRVDRPELLGRRGLVLGFRRLPWLNLAWLHVHPWFLTDVLRYYVDHPAERAGIGTPAGYDRLRRTLGLR